MLRAVRALHWQVVDFNQCLCLPKAKLKTKTNPNGHHSVAVWVRFGFQLDSLEKNDPLNKKNFVGVLKISFVYVDSEPLSNYSGGTPPPSCATKRQYYRTVFVISTKKIDIERYFWKPKFCSPITNKLERLPKGCSFYR